MSMDFKKLKHFKALQIYDEKTGKALSALRIWVIGSAGEECAKEVLRKYEFPFELVIITLIYPEEKKQTRNKFLFHVH